jgi:radical SAM protein with 4Fe4S-binding SPASM domain
MDIMTKPLRTPCQIDIEITSQCNHSCRYCYNFWRHDKDNPVNARMSIEVLDRIIDDIIENKVFNVVLTGGEPFVNYPVLLHGVRRLTEAGILVSCNSNLTLATYDQLKELHESGLPHILTSLASYDPVENDRIFNKKGSFVKVVQAIRNAVSIGIKISLNTVISQASASKPGSVYRTGLLAHALGAKNLFLTRVVPNDSCPAETAKEFVLSPELYIPVLEEALQVKKETGITIGSLIQYPVCFLQDVERFNDFIGRGCTAGKKMICINADGNTHACFHQKKTYGNVLDIGLLGVWENMEAWRDGSLIPLECKECKWLPWCEGGCRVYAASLDSKDYMCRGASNLPDPAIQRERYFSQVTENAKFQVRQGLRYREEDGYWLAHTVGAWITPVSNEVVLFLKQFEKSQESFGYSQAPGGKETTAYLLMKNLLSVV